jgi:hypothetical protein
MASTRKRVASTHAKGKNQDKQVILFVTPKARNRYLFSNVVWQCFSSGPAYPFAPRQYQNDYGRYSGVAAR